MRQITTKCPSGLTVTLRGLKGQEINLFANKTEVQQRRIGNDLLKNCVLSVDDPGPMYPGLDSSKPDWSRVVVADRFWIYLQMRVATYKDDYIFRYQCGHAPCRKTFEWGLKLSALGQKPLPEETVSTFLAGNRFGPVRCDGKDVVFQLVTGAVEEKGITLQDADPDEASTVGIANRIVSVDGQDGRTAVHEWVKDLGMLDLLDLTDVLDHHDGGVETNIDIQCPKCGTIQEVELPLGVDFWTPDKLLRSLMRRDDAIIEPAGGPIRRS